MPRTSPLTPDQVKTRLRQQGVTITQWATANGYVRQDVYRVLNGQLKANFGRAHEIAVKLALKVVPSDESMPTKVVGNPQAKRVA